MRFELPAKINYNSTMCSEYTSKTTQKELEDALTVSLKNLMNESSWDKKIKMSLQSPILELQNNEIVLTEARFPTPPPFPNSRLSDLKENKRTGEIELTRIYDVASWKHGFNLAPCIVPMKSFIEPVYWGPELGSAMRFSSEQGEQLFVAGLRMIRSEKEDKTLAGFSLITHTASEQMLKYHHRLIVKLKAPAAIDYLAFDGTPEERFNFLLENRYMPNLKAEKDRTMVKKPKSRIDEQVAKLEKEMQYREFLKTEGVAG